MNSARQLLTVSLLCALAAPVLAQDFSQTQTAPAPTAALVTAANNALDKSDFPTALTLLTKLNAAAPNDPHTLFNLGYTQEALGDPTAASADYRLAIAADPTFADPHIALGLLLARTSPDLQSARTELRLATTLPAEPALKARAFRALARLDLAIARSDPTIAASDLLAALKLTPETLDDILLAAEIAETSTPPDFPAAEQAYRRYLALPGNAGDPAATAALAHTLIAQNHFADAEAIVTPALAAHPGDPALTAQLARASLASDDPAHRASAIPLLEALHTAHPTDVSIGRLLASLYAETANVHQADELYQALIAASEPTPDPTLLDDRATLLLRLHRPGEAESLLKQAVANPSAFPSPAALGDAATHLAFAASEIDDPKMTLQALTLRATVLPPSPSSLYLEATANDALHHNTQASSLYAKFLTLAAGKLPDQESQARQRLAILQHSK